MEKRKYRSLVRLNRKISWILLLVAIATIFSGYALSHNVFNRYLLSPVHIWLEISFTGLLVLHILLTLFLKSKLRSLFTKVREGKASKLHWLKIIQKITAWAIVFAALLVIISGLDWYILGIPELWPFAQHLNFDVLLFVLIIIHAAIGVRFALARRGVKSLQIRRSLLVLVIVFSFFIIYSNIPSTDGTPPVTIDGPPITTVQPPANGDTSITTTTITGAGTPFTAIPPPTTVTDAAANQAAVYVGDDRFIFRSDEVVTTRPDIFQPGQFSMFDVLVNLAENGKIDLEYHFDDSMNTHVIDSINGEPYWWYRTWYSGGWSESNSFRMDHYPWKPQTNLYFFKASMARIDGIHFVFADEIARKNTNGGEVIIPEVIIEGPSNNQHFFDVSVTPHNLRSDVYREGVITAIDVIMSLADQGKLTYELQWYDSIGSAGYVRSYWVEAINDDIAYGGCGFVYESGSYANYGFTGNHIHLPSDVRVLNSPEYNLWFWICL